MYDPESAEGRAYGQGYADGKGQAHFELRDHMDSSHNILGCGCENCQTYRVIMDYHLRDLLRDMPLDVKVDLSDWLDEIGFPVEDDDG